jgi:hypothetical protein
MGVGVVLTQHGHQGAPLSKAFGAANIALSHREKDFFGRTYGFPICSEDHFLSSRHCLFPQKFGMT